jgi:cell pole-organizing protein PopZ
MPEPAPPQSPAPEAAEPSLVGAGTAAATAAAFASLSEQINPPKGGAGERHVLASGRTVEELVEDMLRPMLKDWLDQNLPASVERIVQREIERIRQRSGQ